MCSFHVAIILVSHVGIVLPLPCVSWSSGTKFSNIKGDFFFFNFLVFEFFYEHFLLFVLIMC